MIAEVDRQEKERISLRRELRREIELHKPEQESSKGLGRVLRRRTVLRETILID